MKDLDVITMGETMVVFNPMQDLSLSDSHLFLKQIGGAESNFATGLSRLGHKVGWISRLGDDSLGYYIHNNIRGNGVDTSLVEFDEQNPTGIMIKERLIQNQVNVHYYRKNTAASFMGPEIIDETYFSKAKYLYLTGITPALSESCKQLIFKSIETAKRLGLKVIFDPNIRFKLAKDLNAYRDLLNEIVSFSDYFLPGIPEAKFLSECDTPEEVADYYLALNNDITLILKLGSEGCFYANEKQRDYVKGFTVEQVIDPVGAGDGFAAGFVSGMIEGKSIKGSLEQANLIGSIIVQTNGDVEGFPSKKEFYNYKEQLYKSMEEVNR